MTSFNFFKFHNAIAALSSIEEGLANWAEKRAGNMTKNQIDYYNKQAHKVNTISGFFTYLEQEYVTDDQSKTALLKSKETQIHYLKSEIDKLEECIRKLGRDPDTLRLGLYEVYDKESIRKASIKKAYKDFNL